MLGANHLNSNRRECKVAKIILLYSIYPNSIRMRSFRKMSQYQIMRAQSGQHHTNVEFSCALTDYLLLRLQKGTCSLCDFNLVCSLIFCFGVNLSISSIFALCLIFVVLRDLIVFPPKNNFENLFVCSLGLVVI